MAFVTSQGNLHAKTLSGMLGYREMDGGLILEQIDKKERVEQLFQLIADIDS